MIFMKRIVIVGYLIAYLSGILIHAQSQHAVQNQYKFKYLTVDQGLSHNHILSICQDSKGFIWMATVNGVDKFYGQTNVYYRQKPQDRTTISSNYERSVFLDSKNNLWIGSTGGLDLYNANFNNFIRFKHKDIDWPIEEVFEIDEDKNSQKEYGQPLPVV